MAGLAETGGGLRANRGYQYPNIVDPQNPTRVAVLMDVADMDAVMAAMQTKEMADAMEYDGVLPETLVILVEA